MASRVGNYVGVKLNGYEKNSEQKCKWLQILCSRRHGTICFEIAATPHIWQWQVLWTFQYMIPLCFVFLLWSHIKRIPRHKQLKSGTERIKNKWIKVKDILLNVWFREIIESIRIIHYYKLQILTHCVFVYSNESYQSICCSSHSVRSLEKKVNRNSVWTYESTVSHFRHEKITTNANFKSSHSSNGKNNTSKYCERETEQKRWK